MFHTAPARHSDIDDLMRIQKECGLSGWTKDAYSTELERDDAVMLVTRGAGQIVGFIAGRAPRSGGDAEIYNIGTTPNSRRQGVGSWLLRAFIAICREKENASVWLEVRAGNAAAISFYRSHGFVPAGTRKNFYSHPDEDACLMVLGLTDAA